MELSLIALNLFNQGTYGNTVYSGGRTSKEYQLRGRTILMSIFFIFSNGTYKDRTSA